MLIQCPSCKARAKLPDSKEGAKVRCPQCERVYVARPRDAAAASRGPDPTKWFLFGGVALALVALMLALRNQKEDAPVVAAEPPPPPPPAPVDTGGWESPAVRAARALHEHAAAAAEVQLAEALAPDRAWALRAGAAAEPPDDEELPPDETTPRASADDRSWAELSTADRLAFSDALVAELEGTAPGDVVAGWEPFDGEVLRQSDEESTVRLTVTSREDPAAPNRHVDWSLARVGGAWKAYEWQRWMSEQELAALRAARSRKTVQRTLSDGSFVIEGKVRPIDFLPETSAEERARIDGLCADLVDLEARPSVRFDAGNALAEIGKPAIPALLTRLATIPLETEEQAIQLNLVHDVLTEITGYATSFEVHEAVGATEERQESALKQWFGWYDRKFERFEERAEEEDPFGDLAPRNEKERREFEKIRREGEDG